MRGARLYNAIGAVAHDLRYGGYTDEQLRKVCLELAREYRVRDVDDIFRRVQATYVSLYVYKD